MRHKAAASFGCPERNCSSSYVFPSYQPAAAPRQYSEILSFPASASSSLRSAGADPPESEEDLVTRLGPADSPAVFEVNSHQRRIIMTDFISNHIAHRRAQAEANDHNRTVVLDALSAAGITSVTVDFDGEGDSGQINGVHCKGSVADIAKISVTTRHAAWGGTLSEQTETLESAVESLCYGYLAFEHGGWENNDGAFGEFTIDVAARTIALEFSARFSTYDTTWHDF
jgi:hypothetical protein